MKVLNKVQISKYNFSDFLCRCWDATRTTVLTTKSLAIVIVNNYYWDGYYRVNPYKQEYHEEFERKKNRATVHNDSCVSSFYSRR